jgi:hypothetical protein
VFRRHIDCASNHPAEVSLIRLKLRMKCARYAHGETRRTCDAQEPTGNAYYPGII